MKTLVHVVLWECYAMVMIYETACWYKGVGVSDFLLGTQFGACAVLYLTRKGRLTWH